MATPTSKQYQLPHRGGPFTLATIPKPTPQSNEITIRTKAIALNPLDSKARLYGAAVPSWPAVLGIDVSGVIESVGSDITNFQPGDEVFSLAGTSTRSGGYQELVTVPSNFVAKKPPSLTFEEASTLPIIYLTACAIIANGLGISLFNDAPSTPSTEYKFKSILVLGGSSGVGSSAIQILRLLLPQTTKIYTTASAQYTQHLISLGADLVFDRHITHDNPSEIIAASHGGKGVDAIIDAVGAASQQTNIVKALNPEGQKVYSAVFTNPGAEVKEIPGVEGAKIAISFGRQTFGLPGGDKAMEILGRLVEDGKFKLPKKVEVIGTGWDVIPAGLDRVMKGVGGSKLVVKI